MIFREKVVENEKIYVNMNDNQSLKFFNLKMNDNQSYDLEGFYVRSKFCKKFNR